jgi:hypothetical protein
MTVKKSKPNDCDEKEGQPRTRPSGKIVEIGRARFERFMRYKEEMEKEHGVIFDPAWKPHEKVLSGSPASWRARGAVQARCTVAPLVKDRH